MFTKIGQKIKTYAVVITVIGIIVSFAYAVVIWATDDGTETGMRVLFGLLVLILGSVGSWIGSFLIYGFGHLIVTADEIKTLLCTGAGKAKDTQAAEIGQPKATDPNTGN